MPLIARAAPTVLLQHQRPPAPGDPGSRVTTAVEVARVTPGGGIPLHPTSLGMQDAMGRTVITQTPVVVYWLVLDARGMVVAVKRVDEYGRKPLSKEVLG